MNVSVFFCPFFLYDNLCDEYEQRQKVVRKIHVLDRQLAESNVNTANYQTLLGARIDLMSDLAYIIYFPNQMKYVSVFACDDKDLDRKSERSRLKARALALAEWNSTKASDAVDRVERLLSGEQLDVSNQPITQKRQRDSPTISDEREQLSQDTTEKGTKPNRKKGKPSEPEQKADCPYTSANASIVEEEDSFFLEGSGGVDDSAAAPFMNPNYSARSSSTGTKGGFHQSSHVASVKGQRKSYAQKTASRRNDMNPNDAPMTKGAIKQNLRLQRWQTKQGR